MMKTTNASRKIGISSALAAAALFGVSTPLAKNLLDAIDPVLLAGLFYLGSGVGLFCWLVGASRLGWLRVAESNHLAGQDILWLSGAVLAGGLIGPLLLMTGLSTTPATSAALLLNLEGVFTALLAWFVFRENFDRRIFLGMLLIVGGGGVLSGVEAANWQARSGAVWITLACLAWAVDNNLTRKVSGSNAVEIAAIKGVAAGVFNTVAAVSLGAAWPRLGMILNAGIIGLLGYGISLVLFVVALRHLGTARTGAYFSTGPFIGAAVSLIFLGENVTTYFWLAAAMMGVGVWLHLSEKHSHLHSHEPITHTHVHSHDEHHRHEHGFLVAEKGSHSHSHQHEELIHSHEHFPDLHHRHDH